MERGNSLIESKFYRAGFVLASLLVSVFGFLFFRDWHIWFNWFFFIVTPLFSYLWFLPFIGNDDLIFPARIGKSPFEIVVRHGYVIMGSCIIAHSLTGFSE